jgi:hypothetical protein
MHYSLGLIPKTGLFEQTVFNVASEPYITHPVTLGVTAGQPLTLS